MQEPDNSIGAIIIAVLGFLSALAATITAWFTSKRERAERALRVQAELEMSIQRGALDFAAFVEEWGEVNEEIVDLIDETEIDRFIILRAWNGYLKPRWTTAVYQVREITQKPVSYIHIKLDDEHINRLRELVTTEKPIYRKTEELPESLVKQVYESEGVTSVIWNFLSSETLQQGMQDKPPSVAITYCSFATHKGEISEHTRTRCELLANRLSGIANAFSKELPGI